MSHTGNEEYMEHVKEVVDDNALRQIEKLSEEVSRLRAYRGRIRKAYRNLQKAYEWMKARNDYLETRNEQLTRERNALLENSGRYLEHFEDPVRRVDRTISITILLLAGFVIAVNIAQLVR